MISNNTNTVCNFDDITLTLGTTGGMVPSAPSICKWLLLLFFKPSKIIIIIKQENNEWHIVKD